MICAGVISSVFNPSDFIDVYRWYDASDTSSITSTTVGSVTYVTGWNDKSGNNYHATDPGSATTSPTLSTSNAGLTSINFGSSGETYDLKLATDASIWDKFQTTTFYSIRKGSVQNFDGCVTGWLFRYKAVTIGGSGIQIGGSVSDFWWTTNKQSSLWGKSGAWNATDSNSAWTEKSIGTSDIDFIVCHQQNHQQEDADCVFKLFFNNEDAISPSESTSAVNARLDIFSGTDAADGQTKDKIADFAAKHYLGGAADTTFSSNNSNNRLPFNTQTPYKGHIMELIEYDRILSEQEIKTVVGHLMGKWRVS